MAMITASHGRSFVTSVWRAEQPARVQHHLAHAGAHRVHGDDVAAGRLVVDAELLHDEQPPPLHEGLLAAGDDGPGDPSQEH